MNKTEEELLLHISRLEAIIDNMPFEVWYKDTDCKYLIINKNLQEYLGKPKEEIIGKNNYELYPQDAAKMFAASDKAVLEGEELKFFELDFENNSYEEYKRPAFDVSGNLVGITGVSRNITQRKKAVNKLLESERSKLNLLSNMPGVTFRCANDASYTVISISDGCYDLTGYTAEELVSMKPSYNDLILPEYRSALINKWNAEDDDDAIATDEYPILTKSEGIKWVMEQSQRVYDADRNVIGSEGFIVDVTQRKLAEKALKQSEERFRTIFEGAPLGMAIVDSHTGNIRQVNTRYAEIVGRTKAELLLSSIKDLSYADEFDETHHKISLMNAGEISNFSFYKRLVKLDGTAVWINMTIAPFSSKDEYESPRFLCMIEDVSARKEAEEEIRFLSYHDQLTGLYNRRFYEEELRRLDTERNLPITLIMADVNGLKLTNDAFGHLTGDRLLKHIAVTVKNQCRSNDIIARIGGDEFIILLSKTDSNQAEELVARISSAIKEDKSHPVVCSASFGWDTKREAAEDIEKIYARAEDLMYRHKLSEGAAMRRSTIRLIFKTLLKGNEKEARHAKKVSCLCMKMAKALGMNPDEVREMRLAGLAHDIGHIGIREELLDKESLTEEEWIELERHQEIGYQLLRSVGKYSSIAEYILYHHERVDGAGYPGKLVADKIPVQSRIIAVADAYDDLTGGNAGRKKLSHKEAVDEIEKNAGTKFDLKITEVFIHKVLEPDARGYM